MGVVLRCSTKVVLESLDNHLRDPSVAEVIGVAAVALIRFVAAGVAPLRRVKEKRIRQPRPSALCAVGCVRTRARAIAPYGWGGVERA